MTVSAFAVNVTKALGRDKSLVSIATAAILALISFFYIYTLGSYFKIGTSVLHQFYNYIGFFQSYVAGKYVDHIIIALSMSAWFSLAIKQRSVRVVVTSIYVGFTAIAVLTGRDIILDVLALLSIPLLVAIFACNRFVPKLRILKEHVDTDLSTNYIIIAGLIISIASLIVSIIPFFLTSYSTSTPVRNYGYEIFVLLYSFFSPLLMAVLILCVPIKLLFDGYMENRANIKSKREDKLQQHHVSKDTGDKGSAYDTMSKTKIIFYLSFFMVLAATIALIPHLPAVNKDNRPVGADIQDYTTAIKHMSLYSNNPQELIGHAFVKEFPFYGDRPLSLLLFYAVAKVVSSDPTYVIDYLPIILGPALVLAIYFLTREMTSNHTVSLLAGFMTALSFQVLVGIYSGFYANWFALIIGYFSFVFLFRFLKRSGKLNLIGYTILVILLLLSHVYTWAMLAVVTVLFLLVMLKLNYYRRRNIILLLLVIISPAAIDAIRSATTGAIGGISSGIQFAPHLSSQSGGPSASQFFPQSSLAQLTSFRNNLLDTTEHFLGGLFGNFVILALGFYWLLRSNRFEPHNIFIMTFLSVGIVPLFFSDWILQTRVFYDIPFQIPAAAGLSYVLMRQRMKGIMMMIPICIWLVAVSIVNVSNFYPA